jgi:hypothetical protein
MLLGTARTPVFHQVTLYLPSIMAIYSINSFQTSPSHLLVRSFFNSFVRSISLPSLSPSSSTSRTHSLRSLPQHSSTPHLRSHPLLPVRSSITHIHPLACFGHTLQPRAPPPHFPSLHRSALIALCLRSDCALIALRFRMLMPKPSVLLCTPTEAHEQVSLNYGSSSRIGRGCCHELGTETIFRLS